MTRVYAELQWDEEAGEVRMSATTGFGPQHDAYRVAKKVAGRGEAAQTWRDFIDMYRDQGYDVVTRTGTAPGRELTR